MACWLKKSTTVKSVEGLKKSVVIIKKLKQPKICTIKTVESAWSTCFQLEDSTSSSKFSSMLVDPVNLCLRLSHFFPRL
jgi:hypothetical protein